MIDEHTHEAPRIHEHAHEGETTSTCIRRTTTSMSSTTMTVLMDVAGVESGRRDSVDSRTKYLQFTGRLCLVTGVALLAVALAVAVRGEWPSAAVWCAAVVVLIVLGRWRLKSPRR